MTLEEENGRPHAKSSTTQARAVDPEGLRSDKPLTHRGRHPARDINAKSPRAIRWCLDSGVEVFLKGVLSGKPEGIQARRHRGGWLRTREHGECATALEGVWGEAELLERVFDPPGRRPQHRGGADDDGRGDGRMADAWVGSHGDGRGRLATARRRSFSWLAPPSSASSPCATNPPDLSTCCRGVGCVLSISLSVAVVGVV
eukprot:CAMPEP_0175970874 /NCGR_PEP_ID=MMETSP0108-20121206/41320_1 /TAXON_ID=195067 ORGANISM="Goniomonas pacifica, Strain CCMP1869" /NCGR_SAMPLE_ID=MMETSP0108 /ASSEMBLY_ACC=CAM_ASM_000204 /LENGTH=200 /DNA_ID=CAMNT_0017299937 /DNA_START=166 /DNA_END=764 /DNA_ORIENTATION=-